MALTDWTDRLARHRSGLAALSFAESTVVPIPLETIVAPLMVCHYRRALVIATAIWAGCILGAALFYWLGFFLAEPVIQPVIDWLGLSESFNTLTDDIDQRGLFWVVLLVSFSPAPMQIATLGAGTLQGPFGVFLAAIAISRGVRYFGLALLARVFGPRIAKLDLPTGRLVLFGTAILLLGWVVTQVLP